MKKSFMATGLAVATLAAGCGSNNCPTPTTPAKPTGPTAAEKANAQRAKNQAAIDKIAQDAVSHYVNLAANAYPKIAAYAKTVEEFIPESHFSVYASKARNFDGSRFTHMLIDTNFGEFGKSTEYSDDSISAQYEDGHPGNVRSLIVSSSDTTFKKNAKGHIKKHKDGSYIVNEDVSDAGEYHFTLKDDGHWKLRQVIGGAWTHDMFTTTISTPDAAREFVSEARQDLENTLDLAH
jgi:hypothetical protein